MITNDDIYNHFNDKDPAIQFLRDQVLRELEEDYINRITKGLDCADIANMYNISAAGVKVTINRGLRRAREYLEAIKWQPKQT